MTLGTIVINSPMSPPSLYVLHGILRALIRELDFVPTFNSLISFSFKDKNSKQYSLRRNCLAIIVIYLIVFILIAFADITMTNHKIKTIYFDPEGPNSWANKNCISSIPADIIWKILSLLQIL